MDSLRYDTEKALRRCSDSAVGLTCDHHIDVVHQGSLPESILNLSGVTSVSKLGDSTFRIQYDASILGARDLLEHGFGNKASLAPENSTSSFAAQRRALTRLFWKTVLSIVLTLPVLTLAWLPGSSNIVVKNCISLFFATLLQVLVAFTFYSGAYKAVFHKHVADVDVLIALSTTTAYVFSVVAFAYQVIGKPLKPGMFFQTSALLATIVLLGRLVADYSHQRAFEMISIKLLQPQTAIVVSDDKADIVIDARLLQHGDTVKVLPDSKIPTDAVVINGVSEVDESMITGEANLVVKNPGSRVIAGSLNHQGMLLVRLTRLLGDNTISQIAEMTDEALTSKPKSRQIADLVAAWFVPVMVFLSIVTFFIWVAIGRSLLHKPGSEVVVSALTYAIAVLIVSCPCAIGLAVPMVVVIASGIAAKRGIIFKSGRTIETARKVHHVIFDKTGTLTEGRPAVIYSYFCHRDPEFVRSLFRGLLSSSSHPISRAIVEDSNYAPASPAMIDDIKAIPGKGVLGKWHGQTLRGGNVSWLGLEGHFAVQHAFARQLSIFCLMLQDELIAVIGLQDPVRNEAFDVISKFKQRGVEVSLLSGDNAGSVEKVGRMLGIPFNNVRSRATPADKQDYIRSILAKPTSSGRTPHVLFCGDGTNDSVALAQATIGVYMSGGTDIAKGAADVVLASRQLNGVLLLMDISQAAFRRIVLNFVWAFLYNVFAVLLAAGAFKRIGFRLEPQYAAIGELVSIVPVILVAFQLKLKSWKL
jgi:Cd2+-exporting ATPase